MTRRGINFQSPVNWSHPLNCGLASWWLVRPDLVRGNTWYDLCGRNHGTLTNMDPATDWVGAAGRPGGFGAIDFDGTNDRVSMTTPSAITLSSQPITLVAHAMARGDGNFLWVSEPTTHYVRLMRYENAVYANTSSSGTNAYKFSTLPTGAWAHLVAVFESGSSSSSPEVYVNGARQTLAVITTLASQTADGNIHIGARSGPGFFLSGQVSEARIYNRALSAAEVLALYQDSCQGYPGTLARLRRRRACVFAGGGGGG